jgi:hypothetical protein
MFGICMIGWEVELTTIGWDNCERWLNRLCFEIRVDILLSCIFFFMKRLVDWLLSILNLHLRGMLEVLRWHPLQDSKVIELEEMSFRVFWWLIWMDVEDIFFCFFPTIISLFWIVANHFLLGFCRMFGILVYLYWLVWEFCTIVEFCPGK